MYCGRCGYTNPKETERQEIEAVNGEVIIKTGQLCLNCGELLLDKEYYKLAYVETCSREEAKNFLFMDLS